MRTDDLAPLFPHGGSDMSFSQGKVLEWNPETGANVVRVGAGAELSDLPILNTGEAVALRAGHVVGLLRVRSSYFILGRVTLPASEDFAGASVAFDGTWGSAQEFELRNDVYLQISGNIQVPSWADEALVLVTANMTVTNTSAVGGDFATFEAVLDNGPGRPSYPEADINQSIVCVGSAQRVIDVSGRSEFMVGCRWHSQEATWPAYYANIANFDAIATFRSVT